MSIRELSTRLSLHPNTLRPHLRRLEEAGLAASEVHRGATVGRPQVLYTAVAREEREGRDYRLLGEILAGLIGGKRAARTCGGRRSRMGRLPGRAERSTPGRARVPPARTSRVLQEALAEAGFDPRFRRRSSKTVEISLRDCPFRDLLDEHRELVCAVHKGLLEGMLGASRPSLRLTEFEPLAERSAVCRLVARGA